MKIKERAGNQKLVSGLVRVGWHNSIKCSSGIAESYSHQLLKFMICSWCWRKGVSFYTEANFHDNQRADIIIADWGIVLEILNTEELKDFKKKTYPLPTIPVSTKSDVFQIDAMMDDLSACDGKNYEYYQKNYQT